MKKIDITILTDNRWVNPAEPDWYSDQVILEDQLLRNALEKSGLKVARVSWDDPEFDWSETRYAMFRTVWDYSKRWEEFDAWFRATAKVTEFINPEEQIRWNLDKKYLVELERSGVNIPATRVIEKGSTTSLKALFNETNWTEAVLKPMISGGGRETHRLKADQVEEFESKFRLLVQTEAMMLQEFQYNVVERGEVSMMFAGTDITHAIIKKAKAGDFRVQDDFGGTVHQYEPTDSDLAFAKKVLSACKNSPILGRVDMIWDNDGDPALGELEIIEPEMWFRFAPTAANAVAKAIFKRFFS